MKYKHLSYSDRQEMEKLYLQGWHMNDIAAKLGVSLATVYHERARGDTGQIIGYGLAGLFLFVFGVWLAHGFYGQADKAEWARESL